MVLEDHPELAADEQFHKARDTVNRSIESLRRLMFELRPYVLDHDGLAAALAMFVVEEGKLPGSATYKVQSGLHSEPPESVRVILYRIAQEALVNVRKHAHATQVKIALEESDDGYTLQVKDDGVGFEPSEISDPSLARIVPWFSPFAPRETIVEPRGPEMSIKPLLMSVPLFEPI